MGLTESTGIEESRRSLDGKKVQKAGIITIIIGVIIMAIGIFVQWGTADDYWLYTIEMTLVNNQKVTDTYKLPVNTRFSVNTFNGSYWLEYDNMRHASVGDYFGRIRNGVIDFRVTNVTNLPKSHQ